MSPILKDAGWILVDDGPTPSHREWQDPYDPLVRAPEPKALVIQQGRERKPASVQAEVTRGRARCARCGVTIPVGATAAHVKTGTRPAHSELWCRHCCQVFGVKI
jgi:hypothetical protein